jgi:hypothetical protein
MSVPNKITIVVNSNTPVVKILEIPSATPIKVIQANIGPQGPQGIQGNTGAYGKYVIVPADHTLAVDETLALMNGGLNLTLPLISSILVGQITKKYTIRNLTNNPVNIIANIADNIEGSATLVLNGYKATWDLLPTSLGWLIV